MADTESTPSVIFHIVHARTDKHAPYLYALHCKRLRTATFELFGSVALLCGEHNCMALATRFVPATKCLVSGFCHFFREILTAWLHSVPGLS